MQNPRNKINIYSPLTGSATLIHVHSFIPFLFISIDKTIYYLDSWQCFGGVYRRNGKRMESTNFMKRKLVYYFYSKMYKLC